MRGGGGQGGRKEAESAGRECHGGGLPSVVTCDFYVLREFLPFSSFFFLSGATQTARKREVEEAEQEGRREGRERGGGWTLRGEERRWGGGGGEKQ